MPPHPRVLLADDHQLFLDGLVRVLQPNCDIVGCVSDGHALLQAASRLKPDIIILDIAMPGLNGLDAGRQLQLTAPVSRLVYLTANEDPDLAREAFGAGASAYLLKHSAASELFHAILEVLAGKLHLTPLIARGVPLGVFLSRDVKAVGEKLTVRQRQVLQLLAEGRTMKEVASLLGVTPRTVAFHKYTMMEQLGLETGAELVQYAVANRIVVPRSGDRR